MTDLDIIKDMLARAGQPFGEYGRRPGDNHTIQVGAPERREVPVCFEFTPEGGLIRAHAEDPYA